jgi:hypothetical protein
LDGLEPELRFKCCQKGYTDDMYDDKSEYYIPNWAAKMGSESDFVNTLRSYEFYGRNDVTTIPLVAITTAILAAIRAVRRLSVECNG